MAPHSIDLEKAFEKIQHPFMINTLNKVGLEEHTSNMVMYDKPQLTSYSTV